MYIRVAYTAGMVINRAGASILNNASANSAFQNYSITSNTVTTGGNPVSSTFTENVGWVGGVASLDNFGYIGGEADAGQFNFVTDFFDVASGNATGGVQFGNLTNEQGAHVGGFVSANSLFIGVNNVNGNVTSPLYGGFANVTNKGIVGEGFYVTSLKGSTLFNAANAQINGDGGDDSFMLTVNGQNSFTNFGTIGSVGGGNIGGIGFGNALSLYVDSLLGIPSEDFTDRVQRQHHRRELRHHHQRSGVHECRGGRTEPEQRDGQCHLHLRAGIGPDRRHQRSGRSAVTERPTAI